LHCVALCFTLAAAFNSGINPGFLRYGNGNKEKGNSMKNPLDSIIGTIISGFALTVVLAFIAKSMSGS
jgi:hypothetical protein